MGNRNIIVGQSGGPTSVINSSLAGAIDCAFSDQRIDTVYGMLNGVEGLLENNIINLSNHSVDSAKHIDVHNKNNQGRKQEHSCQFHADGNFYLPTHVHDTPLCCFY